MGEGSEKWGTGTNFHIGFLILFRTIPGKFSMTRACRSRMERLPGPEEFLVNHRKNNVLTGSARILRAPYACPFSFLSFRVDSNTHQHSTVWKPMTIAQTYQAFSASSLRKKNNVLTGSARILRAPSACPFSFLSFRVDSNTHQHSTVWKPMTIAQTYQAITPARTIRKRWHHIASSAGSKPGARARSHERSRMVPRASSWMKK